MKKKQVVARHLTTEKAMREALRSARFWNLEVHPTTVKVMASDVVGNRVAIFDLRDCIKLRAPLKGIKKALNRAIAPRRKRK